jgi:hypothetical protein
MNRSKPKGWLTVIGNFAVAIGLFVVTFEIRQNSTLARGDSVTQFVTNWEEIDRSRQDPAFAVTYAKSIERPQDLTLAEMIQLDGYYFSIMDQLNIDFYLVEFGIFKETHELAARAVAGIELSTPFARS